MPSIFHRAAFERPFPVTMLLLELLQQRISDEQAEELTAGQLVPLIRRCIVDAGLKGKASEDDANYVIERLNAMMDEAQKQGDSPPPAKKQTFASSYSNWAIGLEPDALCLAASSYDYFRAAKLYREVDKEDVLWLAERYLNHEWEKIKVGFESVVYGFGGSYKGDSGGGGGGGSSYDMTKDNKQGLAALKKLL